MYFEAKVDKNLITANYRAYKIKFSLILLLIMFSKTFFHISLFYCISDDYIKLYISYEEMYDKSLKMAFLSGK